MKINQLATAFVGRKMTASRGLLGHTLDINKCHHGSPAQKLLFLPQSSVKILSWKHKTGLTSGYRARTAVTALQPCLKHPYSSEKHPILGTWGWGAISPCTLCAWPHSYFGPREQTEAMGMSTAVKEIKHSAQWMLTLQLWWLFSLRRVSPWRSRDVWKVLGHRPAAAEEQWAQFLRARESRRGYWSAAVAGLGWTSWVRVGSALGQKSAWPWYCPTMWSGDISLFLAPSWLALSFSW